MDSVQIVANNSASSIVSRVQTTGSTVGTLIDVEKLNSLVQKQQLLDTLQLIYSDLLTEVITSPTHKLFYLKSKIDQLNNGQTLSTEHFNYLSILQSELNKLNQDNKLLGRG